MGFDRKRHAGGIKSGDIIPIIGPIPLQANCAVFAEQSQHGPGRDLQVHAPQDTFVVEALLQMVELDH